MNVTVAKRDLLAALAPAASVSTPKSTMSMLANVLLRAGDAGMTVSATDLYVGITQTVDASVKEPGVVALPARELLDRVKLMPDGPVTIVDTDRKTTVSASGKGRTFRLYSDPGEEFPGLATRKPDAPEVRLPCATLARLLSSALRCVAPDESRNIACVRLKWGSGTVDALGTDGHMLLHVTGDAPGAGEAGMMIVPPKAARELVRLCDGRAGDILLSPMDPWSFADIDGVQLSIKLSHDTYPPAENALAGITGKAISVGRAALIDAIRVASLATTSNKAVMLDFSTDGITVRAGNDKGEACDVIPSDWTGKSQSIAMANDYAIGVLGAIPDSVDEITMTIGAALHPVLFTAHGLRGVVMPMDLTRGREATK